MGIISKLRNLFGGGSKQEAAPSDDGAVALREGRSTTASRRAERITNMRYAHVSKVIPEEVRILTVNPHLHDLIPVIMRQTPGTTYTSAFGYIKKTADDIAARAGLNNKQRRRLRSDMRQRTLQLAAERRAAAA